MTMAPPSPDPSSRTLIDDLLAEQQRLTPVERFARKHDRGALPAQARYYRDLIPEAKPKPGQQYAFAVDLDACTGCKACVSACHSLNGLEAEEIWREVGFIHGGTAENPYQQTVTTACHHCVEPGCLEGCPVMAYDKDAETGIVRHLDDQCIGCQYCVLKCPYDVPKYSERLGIVRKCDMCVGRLSAGEAPACVQSCPHEAITITLVERNEVLAASQPGTHMLPGAFDSSYTKPTTRFTSARPVPENAQPADNAGLKLDHAHWPLIGMLLLTQMSAGLFALACFGCLEWSPAIVRTLATVACLALHAGLGVSVLHLGRPLGAWRFFLGLRTSWMSREILAFGLFSVVASGAAAACWVPPLGFLATPLIATSAVLGLAAVFTSVMIYVDTRRSFWGLKFTAPKFYGSTFLLGATVGAAVLAITASGTTAALQLAVTAILIRIGLFAWRSRTLAAAEGDPAHPACHSMRIIRQLLPWVPAADFALLVLSLLAGLAAIGSHHPIFGILAAAFAMISTLAAQVLERFTFFTTCPAPHMPRGVPA